MVNQPGFWRLVSVFGALMCARPTAFGQAQSEAVSLPASPNSRPSAPLAVAATTVDTSAFPLNYATALPRPVFGDWEDDYAKYARFLTPEITRTQLGFSFTSGGITTWRCVPSASPHAQLDTLTRVPDPKQLEGNWESIICRTVVHRDSGVIKEKKFYRSAELIPKNEALTLTLAGGRITILGRHGASTTLEKVVRKKYTVVNGRYLMTYGLSKAGGAISQIGLSKSGHLILHSCAVTERQIKGQYLTYETVLMQNIFKRL